MSAPNKFNALVGTGLLLVVLTVALAFLATGLTRQAKDRPSLPVYGTVGEFCLTNQFGAQVSLAELRGRVWIADIIFTRCAGPCLRMTRQMKALQQAMPPNSPTRLVTLTTDPDYDQPAVLKAYAARFGASAENWLFLTGTKSSIAALAGGSLKLTAIEKKPEERESPEDLFIHSTIFVVVDKKGQLRGIFQTGGEGVDPGAVKEQILAAVRRLEHEP